MAPNTSKCAIVLLSLQYHYTRADNRCIMMCLSCATCFLRVRINAATVVAKRRNIVSKVVQTIYSDYCKIIKCIWTRCVLYAIYLFVEITPGSTGGGAW